jgi:hypothetical protein
MPAGTLQPFHTQKAQHYETTRNHWALLTAILRAFGNTQAQNGEIHNHKRTFSKAVGVTLNVPH